MYTWHKMIYVYDFGWLYDHLFQLIILENQKKLNVFWIRLNNLSPIFITDQNKYYQPNEYFKLSAPSNTITI